MQQGSTAGIANPMRPKSLAGPTEQADIQGVGLTAVERTLGDEQLIGPIRVHVGGRNSAASVACLRPVSDRSPPPPVHLPDRQAARNIEVEIGPDRRPAGPMLLHRAGRPGASPARRGRRRSCHRGRCRAHHGPQLLVNAGRPPDTDLVAGLEPRRPRPPTKPGSRLRPWASARAATATSSCTPSPSRSNEIAPMAESVSSMARGSSGSRVPTMGSTPATGTARTPTRTATTAATRISCDRRAAIGPSAAQGADGIQGGGVLERGAVARVRPQGRPPVPGGAGPSRFASSGASGRDGPRPA